MNNSVIPLENRFIGLGSLTSIVTLHPDQNVFSERLQTLSFRMAAYVHAITSSSDTIPLADSHYARMFGMDTSTDVLLVFSNEKIKSAERVNIYIKEFGFQTGNQFFVFEVDRLNSTPELLEIKELVESIR